MSVSFDSFDIRRLFRAGVNVMLRDLGIESECNVGHCGKCDLPFMISFNLHVTKDK